MANDNTYYRKDPRITFESALLLVIFVGAAMLMAALAYTIAPWESNEAGTTDATVAETQDSGDKAAAEGEELADVDDEPADGGDVEEAAQ